MPDEITVSFSTRLTKKTKADAEKIAKAERQTNGVRHEFTYERLMRLGIENYPKLKSSTK